ncbi:hypothetical protein F5888DRAFT_1640097 [Russula emetica]|nr:hypothetical protein F5888DRAFT_1640097 [Russula emetica]
MIRATGIRYHLDIAIQPKSGYKIRIIMFQSPFGFQELTTPQDKDDAGRIIQVGNGEVFESDGTNPKEVENTDDNEPDRKVYFLIIATPIFGGVEDTGQDMFGIFEGEDLIDEIQHRPMRGGSVFSDRFSNVPVKEEDTAMSDATPQPATGPSTRSKSAAAAALPQVAELPKFPDLHDESPEVLNQLRAMELNRRMARAEAARVIKDPKPVKEPKPPEVPKIETNSYGWAYNNGILIRPTFKVFWYNMPRKQGLRL